MEAFGSVIDIYLFANYSLVYHATSDDVILIFMIEVYWATMLVAFNVPLDQSDDEFITTLCLKDF